MIAGQRVVRWRVSEADEQLPGRAAPAVRSASRAPAAGTKFAVATDALAEARGSRVRPPRARRCWPKSVRPCSEARSSAGPNEPGGASFGDNVRAAAGGAGRQPFRGHAGRADSLIRLPGCGGVTRSRVRTATRTGVPCAPIAQLCAHLVNKRAGQPATQIGGYLKSSADNAW
jgi:hypothetical protein